MIIYLQQATLADLYTQAHGPDSSIAYPHDASLRLHINGRPRI